MGNYAIHVAHTEVVMSSTVKWERSGRVTQGRKFVYRKQRRSRYERCQYDQTEADLEN